jgi:NADH-quinone oxidoreductase subunit M
MLSPIVLGCIVLALPSEPVETPRRTAFVFSLLPLVFSLMILQAFDPTVGTLQLREHVAWIPDLGAYYSLGVDGFSLWLIVLTTVLTPVVLLSSWSDIHVRVKQFQAAMLIMEGLMIGAIVAADLLLFIVFWELMLLPMFLVIGVWGGPRRRYAALKFFLYTFVGSGLMLVAMIYLVLRQAGDGPLSFDIVGLYDNDLSLTEQIWLFSAFAFAFMIKVPMVPFHTWLPDAHTEAPTGGSVDLAGVLLKMGTYGFLRFALPIFPQAAELAFPIIVVLSVIGILYGAMVALPQPDMKRLVAYSSVSHLGFVMLGIYAWNVTGLTGGVLQMVNHGLSTGALFILVGYMYDRRHTREISEYGGLWGIVPIYSALLLVVVLSSIGLPGTNGFVGEFLILIGAFRAYPIAGAIGTLGVVLGAVYLLTMYKHVIFGPVTKKVNETLQDLSPREIAAVAPIIVLIFWIGLYPKPFTDRIEPTAKHLLALLDEKGARRWMHERDRRLFHETERAARPEPELLRAAAR